MSFSHQQLYLVVEDVAGSLSVVLGIVVFVANRR
jgi:hypothetical protein